MKFKAKLSSMKFLTDAEEQDPNNKDLNSNNHVGRNIKIYSNSKTKTVKKLRRYKRRRRFETEDEQEEQRRQQNSREQSYQQTPAGKVKTQRYILSNQDHYGDADLGLVQAEESQHFINSIRAILKK